MASPPLSYATYQGGHRRGQSVASVRDDSNTSKVAKSDNHDKSEHASGSSTTGLDTVDKVQTSIKRPSMSMSQSRPSPLSKDMNGITRGSNAAAAAAAPPPLRTISSIRSTSSANVKSNGKDREIGEGLRVIGQRAMLPPSSSSSLQTSSSDQSRRSVSSSLAIPSSSSSPHLVKESIEGAKADKAATQRLNGHAKRHSYSPSTNLLAPSHSRSASSNMSTPQMPHLISTAQRLRSTNASNTPTTSLSANSSPTSTPRVMSPSLEAMHNNAGPSLPTSISLEGIGRRTAYRPGFQPKGVHRVRTDEFLAAREKRKLGVTSSTGINADEEAPSRGELEAQRLERRLEKLVTLYYESMPVSIDSMPSWLPNTLRKTRQLAEEEKRIREEEMRIVKWEEDSTRKICPICNTPFSLSIRKHHCRLCGRVVCASPHLSTPQSLDAEKGAIVEISYSEEQKCSTLMISEGKKGAVLKDLPRWDPRDGGATFESLEAGRRGIRICKDCRETILHRQYMLDTDRTPAYVRLYDGLVSLQKDIEQSLPEFQEMVLGLQKQDAAAALGTAETINNDILSVVHNDASSNASLAALKAKNKNTLALQRDAAQARKQLLANFANYDLYAKRIRNLDDEGNASLARIKAAIWTKANLFLQQNMFPLQSLPKMVEKKEKKKSSSGTHTPTSSSGNVSDAEIRPFKAVLNEATSSSSSPISNADAKADARALQLVQSDPQAAKETLAVLEQQLSLVLEYAASASRSRKFQDAKVLKASAHDLEIEIARLRKMGVTSSFSTTRK